MAQRELRHLLPETKKMLQFRRRNRSQSTDDYIRLIMSRSEFERLPVKQQERINAFANVIHDLATIVVENKVPTER